jgi:hypothetical protein
MRAASGNHDLNWKGDQMVTRRRILLAAGTLAVSAGLISVGVLHAASLPHYDLDSLILMSSDVVEGRLIGSLRPLDPARGGRGAADSVEVEAVYKGDFPPGDRVELTGLGNYTRYEGDDERKPLMDGDRVFLFLNKPRNSHDSSRKGAGGSKAPALLEPVSSGIKLIERDKVVAFVQFPSDFAPYTAFLSPSSGTHPTVDEFKELLRTRVEQLRPVEARFQQPVSPADTAWLLELLRDRRTLIPKGRPNLASAFQDGIAERARARLASIQDPAALNEALQISGFNSHTLADGFGTPAGLDFLLQRIEADGAPLEMRVLYAKVLAAAARTYYGRLLPPTAAEGVYLTQIANLARDEVSNELLCVALVETIGELARSRPERKAHFRRDWERTVTALARLHQQTTSEQIRFQVELALARHLGSEHARLTEMSGRILSAVMPAEPSPLALPENPRSRWIGYRFHVIRLGHARYEAAEIIARHVESGKTYALGRFEWDPSPEGAGGGGGRLPDDAPPGRYRVYSRFRNRDGTIISIGYGFDMNR